MPRTHIQTFSFRARFGILARLVTIVRQGLARHRDRQMLSRLDPHLLRDIGIDPAAARAESAKPFWRA